MFRCIQYTFIWLQLQSSAIGQQRNVVLCSSQIHFCLPEMCLNWIVWFVSSERLHNKSKRVYLSPIRFQLDGFFCVLVGIVELLQFQKCKRTITVQNRIVRTQFDSERVMKHSFSVSLLTHRLISFFFEFVRGFQVGILLLVFGFLEYFCFNCYESMQVWSFNVALPLSKNSAQFTYKWNDSDSGTKYRNVL